MKKIVVLGVAVIMLFGLSAFMWGGSTTGIKWIYDDYDIAITKAKKEKKPIFIDFYTQWCKPCKELQRDVLSKSEVGAYYNKNFINLKIDCEKKPNGKKIADKYFVGGYPTLLFITPQGKVYHELKSIPVSPSYMVSIGEKATKKYNKLLTKK